jgi:tetratricopeptide (TPR) repeat protein
LDNEADSVQAVVKSSLSDGFQNLLWKLGRMVGEPTLEGIATPSHSQAERLIVKLGEVFDILNDRWGSASVSYILGNIRFLSDDYAGARAYYEQSVADFADAGDASQQGRVCHQLGIVAQKQGNARLAREWYRRALAFGTRLGDHSSVARTCHQLGNLAFLHGDAAEARACYESALDVAKEMDDLGGVARANYQLGLVAQRCGERQSAEQFYERASIAARLLGDGITVKRCRLQTDRLAAGKDADATTHSHVVDALTG